MDDTTSGKSGAMILLFLRLIGTLLICLVASFVASHVGATEQGYEIFTALFFFGAVAFFFGVYLTEGGSVHHGLVVKPSPLST